MRQVRKLKFGNGIQQIKAYRIVDGKAELVDIEYTNSKGVLRWMPPSTGTFNLICEMSPQYSITGLEIVSDAGFAENFNYFPI